MAISFDSMRIGGMTRGSISFQGNVSGSLAVNDVNYQVSDGFSLTGPLPDFHAIDTYGEENLRVVVGKPPEGSRFQGDTSAFELSVKDGCLEVTPKSQGSPATLTIFTEDLDDLSLGGGAHVEVAGLHGSDLSVTAAGTSQARLQGEVGHLSLLASGQSLVDMLGLQAHDVEEHVGPRAIINRQ